jgi:hypothetical protein
LILSGGNIDFDLFQKWIAGRTTVAASAGGMALVSG